MKLSIKGISLLLSCFFCFFLATACSSEGGSHDSGTSDADQDGGEDLCGELPCAGSEDCVAGTVCVAQAELEADSCLEDEQEHFQCSGEADLSCHNTDACSADTDCPIDNSGTQLVCRQGFCGISAPAGPETVTFRGCVDAFGIGDVTYPMQVALYRADQNPTGSSNWDAATTEVNESVCEYGGAFEFTGVPTNTPLILKSYDPDENFVTTYKYNVVLWADLASDPGDGTFVFDTRETVTDPRTGLDISLNPWRGYAISSSTFRVILMATGISSLPDHQGAVAGTLRDCQYRELKNATCGVVEKPEELVYFTNAENPRPDVTGLHASNVNGLYAAIGLDEGKTHSLACLAQNAEGQQVPIGHVDFQVFGDGVTIISMDWMAGLE